MSKQILAILYILSVLLTLAPPLEGKPEASSQKKAKKSLVVSSNAVQNKRDQTSECLDCIDVMIQIIDILVNALANGGVIGSCTDLCGYLPYQVEFIACDLLCSYAGIEVFIQLLNAVDPDPIYVCEGINICPVNDNARAKINSLDVYPKAAPGGTTFNFTAVFTVTNQIGTGDINLTVFPPDGSFPVGGDDFVVNVAPGVYKITFQLSTEPTETDPFFPGVYNTTLSICEGLCGSTHPHSFTLDQKSIQFTITNSTKQVIKPTKVRVNNPLPKSVPCVSCVDFFDETLDELLNIFLNLAVGAGCQEACGQLPETWEVAICSVLCLFAGVEAFADLLNSVDLDPIYLCTALDACPANTCQNNCTKITSATASPKVASLRTTFNINALIQVMNPTGTGVTRAVITPPGGNNQNGPILLEVMNEGWTVGIQKVVIPFETDWEDWNYPYGLYQITVQSCASDCDNMHGIIWSSAFTNLTITE